MPPKTPYPTPSLRLHNGAWKILWSYEGTQYSVSTGLPEGDKVFAEKWRAEFAIALKQDIPAFPEKFADAPAVEKYIEKRYGAGAKARACTGNWLADYEPEIKSECSERWADFSVEVLKKFDASLDGIAKATPDRVSKYLAGIAEKQKPGTRNRVMSILSRFFNWAVRTRRATMNPVAGIKRITEERGSDIIYCTPAERGEAIALAKATEWSEWLAVPVAFYSGMRREEVANLMWPDIRFDAGLIVVTKTKTRKSRTIPLNAALEQYLHAVPETQRTGHVVKCPADVDRLWRMDNLVRKAQKLKKAALLAELHIQKPPPSRSKEYKARREAYEAEKRKQAASIEAAVKRIGWNSFRHTFGSLLAQAGVSLDKISAWMGNTPDVCRRHYAQFIPRDRRDSEIDKL